MGASSCSDRVRRMIGQGVLGTVALWLGACAPENGPADGTARDPEGPVTNSVLLASIQAGMPPSGVTQADLPQQDSLGAELVVQYCGLCHGVPRPSTHAAADWPSVLRRMWLRTDRVRESAGIPAPNAAQRIVILNYVLDNALQVSTSMLPDGRGRNGFVETCSRCNALPDPANHSPDDWASVVLRMKGHMEDLLGETLLQDRIADLVFYLQSVSAP